MIAGFMHDDDFGMGGMGVTPAAAARQAAALAQRQSRAAVRQQATAQRQAVQQERRATAVQAAATRRAATQTKQAARKATVQAKQAARVTKKVGNKSVSVSPEDAKKIDQLNAKKQELIKKIADAKAALALKKSRKGKPAQKVAGMGDEYTDSDPLNTGSITPIDQPVSNTGSTATSIPPTAPSLFGGTQPSVLDLMAPKNIQKHLAAGKLNAKDTQYLFTRMTLEAQQQTQALLQEILSLNQQLMDLLSQLSVSDGTDSTTQQNGYYDENGNFIQTGTTMPTGQYQPQVMYDEYGNAIQGNIQPLQNQTQYAQPFQQSPAYAQQQYMPTVDNSGGYGISPLAQQPQSFQQPMPTAYDPGMQMMDQMPTVQDQGTGDMSQYFSQGSMIVGAGAELPVVADQGEMGYGDAGASGEDVSLDSMVSGDGDVAMFNDDWMGLDYGDLG